MRKNIVLQSTLRDKTLELLKKEVASKQISMAEIGRKTGIRTNWLFMFYANKIPSPSVNYIQALYEYLTKTSIKV